MPVSGHREYLVFTSGDTAGEVTTLDGLRDLLKPIDSFRKAAVVAIVGSQNDLHFDCREPHHVRAIGTQGWEVLAESGRGCSQSDPVDQHRLRVTRDGAVTEAETVRLDHKIRPNCSYGREPAGLRASTTNESVRDLGSHFARAARLEAASVIAFDRIAAELERFNAPSALIALARQSAKEEERHADIMSNLARRFGSEPLTADVDPQKEERTLFDLALENAVEGCVRETYGALVATHQSLSAEDKEIREAMSTIAEDETRHAWFSWQLHEWAKTRLSTAEVTELDAAQSTAQAELSQSLDHSTLSSEYQQQAAGMPSPRKARELFSSLFTSII